MLFHGHLGGSIAKLTGGTRSADVPATGSARSAGAELVRAVKEQLDRGTSLDDVIAKLASSLATSVAAQLGISPEAAQQRLTEAFTAALKPSDTGPPGTNADRAATLVARFRQIAELATRVANGETGQQPIRLIAGQRSDADEAKATPAPQPDSILRDALQALAAPASPAPGATGAPAVPVAPAAATDCRIVALETPAQAVATGGDTLLGRSLARAVLSGEKRPTPVVRPIVVQLHNVDPSGNPIPGPNVGPSSVIDGFVQAFAAALARRDADTSADHGRHGDPSSFASGTSALGEGPAATSSTSQSPWSFAIPMVHDAAPVVPPAPAATLPQPQHVDANAVVDQMLRGMAVRTSDGQSEVRLRLVPESLGDVSVKLIVSGGSVDASITAHTAEAQTALAGGANALAKSLADAGLKLQSFTVGLAGHGFADARDQSRQNDAWTRSGARRIGGLRSADVDDIDPTADVPSIGPPIYSARSLPGSLSYLV